MLKYLSKLTKLIEYKNTVDKNLVKRWKVKLKANVENIKLDFYNEKPPIIKNLSIFNLKFFFFIKTFLTKAR